MQFEHAEDFRFFCERLAGGDAERFKAFGHYFDFRAPGVKRAEFNRVRKKMLAQFLERHGPVCQLRIHPDCSKQQIWVLDHFIPLSSNVLNKTLRRLPRVVNAKVVTQSFGSNHPDNLRLACSRCNAFKMNDLLRWLGNACEW
jgi:hypothetical protein